MVPNRVRSPSGSQRDRSPTAVRETAVQSEDLHVRSYAHRCAYDLFVELVDSDGEVVFEKRYYLQPGSSESETDAVPPGEYEIRAVLDNDSQKQRRCQIGPGPTETAVIELGNGVLSLTEGLRVR
ncbi:hypothetical protein [Halobellus sp. GM3]|uniref:hypothetical protein n=1 Tax=Halobellus sp. GM3 TaxID=3458410 RepID=UPI00403DC7CA